MVTMFRRRKERRDDEFEDEFEDDVQDEYDDDFDEAGDDDAVQPAASVGAPAQDAREGPFDAVAPDDGLPRVDLGGLQIPVLEGIELRVEVDEAGQVVAATL